MRSIFRIKSLFFSCSTRTNEKSIFWFTHFIFFGELYLSCERCFALSLFLSFFLFLSLEYAFLFIYFTTMYHNRNRENSKKRDAKWKQMLFTRVESTWLDSNSLHYKIFFFIIIKHNVVHIRMYGAHAVYLCLFLVISINIFNDPVVFVSVVVFLRW